MMIEGLKRAMTAKQDKPRIVGSGLALSTGSTLLNLAMTGDPQRGWVAGHYFLFVGDSDSGKSWFMHTALAEASINPKFNKYRLIYDNTEAKSLMDISRYFGDRLAARITAPRESNGGPVFSETTEEFYYHVDDALKDGRPFIYILDSQDSLTSNREAKKFGQLKAKARGKKIETSDGDYSDGKAKVHSSHMRQLIAPLAKQNSILIVVNQSRDSFDMYNKDSFSGGRALKFYAVCQLWSSHGGKLQKVYRDKKRQLGIKSKIVIKKNHITGKQSEVVVPIYHSHGIDDVGCCIDWLLDEGVWTKNGSGVIKATGIGPAIEAKYEALVHKIEEHKLEEDLRDLVGETWREIEEATAVNRKSRYS
jgi:hypothetical protein